MIIESKGRGHNLPTGGELFGYLADAFRLRETDELSQIGKKSQQRFFNGEQAKLDPASAEKVIEDVMGAIALLFGKDHFIEDDGERILDPRWINIFVKGGLEAYAMWNTITVRVNDAKFGNTDVGYSALPALRMLAWSFSIRMAAFEFFTTQPDFPKGRWWAKNGVLKDKIDKYCSATTGKRKLTLEKLSETTGHDPKEVTSWRNGSQQPRLAALTNLAGALAKHSGVDRDLILHELRMASALTYLRRGLEEVCGQARIADLLEGVEDAINATKGVLRHGVQHGEADKAWFVSVQVLEHGPHCEEGVFVCENVSKLAIGSKEVADDFMALPQHWESRLRYWAMRLAEAANEEDVEELLAQGMSRDQAILSNKVGLELTLTMGNFFEPDVRLKKVFDRLGVSKARLAELGRFQSDPKVRLVEAAEQAFSTGQLPLALQYLAIAAHEYPLDAFVHYKLGTKAGHMFAYTRSEEFLELALKECFLAQSLKPDWGRPPYEIGYLLANAGRHDEAESQFSRCEDINQEWPTFHLGRGLNYMWMGNYDKAITCFDRVLELEPNHLHAAGWKGACLMGVGQKQKGKTLLKDFARLSGQDLLLDDNWQKVLAGPSRD